jgi:CRISPR-associated protein Csm4
MNYCLYKLNFKTAVHIGEDNGGSSLVSSEMTIRADTLFSALSIEALKNGGEELLKKLYNYAKLGEILFSDLFPFMDEELYLPKPILSLDAEKHNGDVKNRKVFKKLKYIPASQFKTYIEALKGNGTFDAEVANKVSEHIGISEVRTCAAKSGLEETMPYHVGAFKFKEGCGLYVILGYQSEEILQLFQKLLENLSNSGIGGKRTSGLGKFEVDDVIHLDDPYTESLKALSKLISNATSKIKMALTTSLPTDNELDNATEDAQFLLVRRGGFVQSQTYSENQLKKKVLYAFGAGSCFKNAFKGDIYDVSNHGTHPVYRYLKPLFGGIEL